MNAKTQKQRIIWVFLQKDSTFIEADEETCGRLTQRAIAQLQNHVKDGSLVAETRNINNAQYSFKLLRLPNSRSFFLRREQARHYEAPRQQMSLLSSN